MLCSLCDLCIAWCGVRFLVQTCETRVRWCADVEAHDLWGSLLLELQPFPMVKSCLNLCGHCLAT